MSRRFTFYCSSIKRGLPAPPFNIHLPFTFYCSSIKRKEPLYINRVAKYLHSTVVLLKVYNKEKPGIVHLHLHSTVVLLKEKN